MSDLTAVSVALIGTFFLGLIIAPLVIKGAAKLKAGQTILSYVEQHNVKQGTPTFGGLIFLTSTVVVATIFGCWQYSVSRMALLVFLGYGIIGFLDDFIKIKFHENKGLKAYQKIIFQLIVAVFVAYFAYKNVYVGSTIALNFGLEGVDIGVWYIPFAVVTFIAMSNAVNLTDGLDGLAATTSTIYTITLTIINLFMLYDAVTYGKSTYIGELRSLAVTSSALIGGMLAFLWFNNHKASVFMGDTGSLALGAFAAAQALFIKNPLIGVLVGIMFVISCISVIIQVVSFKLRGRRVLLMAPFHHHLELKGINESKIVGYYAIVTIIAGVTALAII
ncbi:MAG: phospho-N-acetylmuramoyl-pentapeptide-transferase [Clostridia bacterium]|nr:phospho-N-acetylmuramoyl-pentapeptide-transferase [Clostridia bacterium]